MGQPGTMKQIRRAAKQMIVARETNPITEPRVIPSILLAVGMREK